MRATTRWAAAATLTLALLSGCSGGGNDDDAASPTTVSEQPPTTQARRITGGPFCEFALTFNDRFGRIAPNVSNPAQLETTFVQAAEAIEDAEQVAPDEIRADVGVLSTAFRDLVVTLQQANFDFTKLPPATLQRLQNPDLQAATQRLSAYTHQNCRAG